jgi:SpoIIAA-like
MLEVMERGGSGNVVGLRVTGTVQREDFRVLTPHVDAAIARHGSVRLLCDLSGWAGIEPGALWEDLRFSLRHARDIDRMAVVTDRRWIERWVAFAGRLVGTEVRCFEPADRDDAWAWVREGAAPRP